MFSYTAALVICAFLTTAASREQVPSDAIVWISDVTGKRLERQTNPLVWTKASNSSRDPCDGTEGSQNKVCLSSSGPRLQAFDGVGCSFLRSGALLLNQLSKARQDEVLQSLWSPTVGAGFRVGKVAIASSDGMPRTAEGGPCCWYSYCESPGNFSLDPDLDDAGGVIPYIRRASSAAGRNISLQATMDFAPLWMLNRTVLSHKTLNILPMYFPDLAQYYLNYTQAMEAQGVPITYLSLFNEPGSVGGYQPIVLGDLRDLLVHHVGPLFRATPGAPQVTFGEQYSRNMTWLNYIQPWLMQDPELASFVDIIFTHGYEGTDCQPNPLVTNFECSLVWGPNFDFYYNTTSVCLAQALPEVAKIKSAFPEKKIWMTEVCYAIEYGDYEPPPFGNCPMLPRTDFEDSMTWSRMLFGDILAGSSAEIYWHCILNTTGGPMFVNKTFSDPPVDHQQPLVIVDVANDSYTLTGAYYSFAHFGRFVSAGMHHVEHKQSASIPNTVHTVSFAGFAGESSEDTAYVVQFANDQVVPIDIEIVFDSYRTSLTLPAISLVTVQFGATTSLKQL